MCRATSSSTVWALAGAAAAARRPAVRMQTKERIEPPGMVHHASGAPMNTAPGDDRCLPRDESPMARRGSGRDLNVYELHQKPARARPLPAFVRVYHPPMIAERSIDVAGRTIRYLDAGGGWPVVLLHAFPLASDMWRPQLERVPQGWRFLAPDLRGFGPAAKRPATSLRDMAEDVLGWLDALRIDEATIGGSS